MKIKWPTLKARLKNPIKTRKEAVQQLQGILPLTELGKKYLNGDK